MKALQNEATRGKIYRVCFAVLALLVAYDVMSGGEQEAWAAVVEAILALTASGLATKNTTARKVESRTDEV